MPDRTKAASAETLYKQLGHHLLQDDTPSEYLNRISRTPEFAQDPFLMLLKLHATGQSVVHHPEGSVWNHTMMVVDQAAKRRNESRNASVFMWAALLHDIGKTSTTRNRNGRITAYNHDKVGAQLAADFLSVLTEDSEFIEKVAALVRFHMHILYVGRQLPFADVGEMKRRVDIREVALLGLCDRLGRSGAQTADELAQIRTFLTLCENPDKKEHAYGKSRNETACPQ